MSGQTSCLRDFSCLRDAGRGATPRSARRRLSPRDHLVADPAPVPVGLPSALGDELLVSLRRHEEGQLVGQRVGVSLGRDDAPPNKLGDESAVIRSAPGEHLLERVGDQFVRSRCASRTVHSA